ncbi:hypothetical protein TNCV_4663831 [Trichonephila clavipes]|uniref:Uncharacterized protein n=1 Tax=Trichonephila clavipes TaxID=2585209 RepID=A0A8X6SD28_TRICX|nr:hypothetical protein TNCV_4663831 [Trichonephila clavipes]
MVAFPKFRFCKTSLSVSLFCKAYSELATPVKTNKTNLFLHQEKQAEKYLPKVSSRNENLLDSSSDKLYSREKLSALKRVNTEMRSTVENENLNSLMLLRAQNDIAIEIDYNDVINDFAIT